MWWCMWCGEWASSHALYPALQLCTSHLSPSTPSCLPVGLYLFLLIFLFHLIRSFIDGTCPIIGTYIYFFKFYCFIINLVRKPITVFMVNNIFVSSLILFLELKNVNVVDNAFFTIFLSTQMTWSWTDLVSSLPLFGAWTLLSLNRPRLAFDDQSNFVFSDSFEKKLYANFIWVLIREYTAWPTFGHSHSFFFAWSWHLAWYSKHITNVKSLAFSLYSERWSFLQVSNDSIF